MPAVGRLPKAVSEVEGPVIRAGICCVHLTPASARPESACRTRAERPGAFRDNSLRPQLCYLGSHVRRCRPAIGRNMGLPGESARCEHLHNAPSDRRQVE